MALAEKFMVLLREVPRLLHGRFDGSADEVRRVADTQEAPTRLSDCTAALSDCSAWRGVLLQCRAVGLLRFQRRMSFE